METWPWFKVSWEGLEKFGIELSCADNNMSRSVHILTTTLMSESLHTWTMSTMEGQISFYGIVPWDPCWGVGLEHL